MRILLRSAALILGATAAALLLAQPASAHADLVRSDPANGSLLTRAPSVARLWFSEEISPEFSVARVVDRTGAAVTGARAEPSGDPRQLAVELPNLRKGTYGLVWRVLAEDDGHRTSGVVVFTVGGASAAAGTITAAASAGPAGTAAAPGGVLLRWLGLCALAGLAGCLAVAGPVLGRARAAGAPDTVAVGVRLARRRLLAVAAGCAVAAGAVGVMTLAEEGQRAAGGGADWALGQAVVDLLTGTRWGHLWLAREIALIALVAVILAIRSRLGEPVTHRSAIAPALAPALAAALVLAVAWVEALGSHSAALQSARAAAVAAYSLHVLTALLWLGALPALVLVLWPRVPGLAPREVVRACRGPFSTLLVISVTVLVVTGLYGAGRQVAEPGQLLSTAYGRTLLLKTALLALVGGLGLANSALLHGRRLAGPGRAPGAAAPSRRLIVAEALAGAVLLAAAGLLAETAPPRTAAPPVPLAQPHAYDTTLGDLVVSVSATPNRPGVNGFTVLAASSRRPPPAPIDRVTLRIGRSGEYGTVPLRQIEPGRYFGTGRLDSAGPIAITVVVRRAGERLTVTVPGRVSPEAGPPAVARPEHPLAPYANAAALCVLLLALGAGARLIVVRRRRHRRRLGTDSPAPAEVTLEEVR